MTATDYHPHSMGYLDWNELIDDVPVHRGLVYKRAFFDIIEDNPCSCDDGMITPCNCGSKTCETIPPYPCSGYSGFATMRFSKRPNFGKGRRDMREYVQFGVTLDEWEPW